MTRINTGDPYQIENSKINSRRDIRPLAIAGFIILCFVAWLGLQIPKGIITETDELLTAERSREMLLTSPWVVHFNFQPSFAKPPLQYWLTTLTLRRFENRTLAVRIWSLSYGVLTAITLACLARLIARDLPWVLPLSVAVLVCTPLFSGEASRGLLDTGLAFFTTLAIAFAQLARKNPAWWIGVAVAGWLGSLQKIPLIFVAWLVILIVRASSPVERRTLFNGWLIGSIIFAVAATAIWPVLQFAQYGMPVESVFNEEIIVARGPEHLGARPYLEIPLRLTTTAWIGGGLVAVLALFAVLFWRKQRFSEGTKEIAILCLTLIALAVLFNFRSVRYMVPVVPCLCLLLAIVFHRLLEQRSSTRIIAAVLLVLLLMAGLAQSQIQIYLRQRNAWGKWANGKITLRVPEKNIADGKQVAEELGVLQREGTKIVLIKPSRPEGDLRYDSFFLFHGNLRFPVTKLTVDELRADPPSAPILGVCVAPDFPLVQGTYFKVQTIFSRAQFILWRVDAL